MLADWKPEGAATSWLYDVGVVAPYEATRKFFNSTMKLTEGIGDTLGEKTNHGGFRYKDRHGQQDRHRGVPLRSGVGEPAAQCRFASVPGRAVRQGARPCHQPAIWLCHFRGRQDQSGRDRLAS